MNIVFILFKSTKILCILYIANVYYTIYKYWILYKHYKSYEKHTKHYNYSVYSVEKLQYSVYRINTLYKHYKSYEKHTKHYNYSVYSVQKLRYIVYIVYICDINIHTLYKTRLKQILKIEFLQKHIYTLYIHYREGSKKGVLKGLFFPTAPHLHRDKKTRHLTLYIGGIPRYRLGFFYSIPCFSHSSAISSRWSRRVSSSVKGR